MRLFCTTCVISAQRNSINPCLTLRHDKEIELFQSPSLRPIRPYEWFICTMWYKILLSDWLCIIVPLYTHSYIIESADMFDSNVAFPVCLVAKLKAEAAEVELLAELESQRMVSWRIIDQMQL